MDKYIVREANQLDASAWNQYILRIPDNPCYMFYEWRFVLEKEYRAKTVLLIAEDGEKNIVGILFAYHLDRPMSALYSPEFGVFSGSSEILSGLIAAAKQYCEENNVSSFLYTTGKLELPLSDINMLSCKQWLKSSFILDLSGGKESVWSKISSSSRNKIRKAEKAEVKIAKGFEYFDSFYKLYSECYSRKGLNIKNKSFFKDLIEKFQSNIELFVCFYKGRLVSGAFFLKNNVMCSYLYNSSDSAYRNQGVNDFLIWQAAQYYIDQGLIGMNLGESMPGSGAYDFKAKQLKCAPSEVHYYLHQNDQQKHSYRFNRFSMKVQEKLIISLCRQKFLPSSLRTKLLKKRALFGRFM